MVNPCLLSAACWTTSCVLPSPSIWWCSFLAPSSRSHELCRWAALPPWGLCLALGSGATALRLPCGTTLLTWLILQHSKAQRWNRECLYGHLHVVRPVTLASNSRSLGSCFIFGVFFIIVSFLCCVVQVTSFFSLWSWLCSYFILCKWLMSLCGKNN